LVAHYDTIGWLITSFFLIFLGTIFPSMFKWINSESTASGIFVFLIIILMSFGFIVARLFLRSQCRKMLELETSEEFFCNTSIWIYVGFIIALEIFIGYFLAISQNFLSFCIIIVIIILMMVWILAGTWCMRKKEEEKKKQKKGKK